MNQTVAELYRYGKNKLTEAGLESPAFDAMCLLDKVFGIGSRAQLATHGNDIANQDSAREYIELVDRRLTTPLQYILGRWEFDGMEMHVGEGVLIPREDTLTIVEAVQNALKCTDRPKILDLCAGTGAIGISLARRINDASVICLEKSDAAMPYLRHNIAEFGQNRVTPVIGDVLKSPDFDDMGKFDCIVSNPPYILSKDMNNLQWEVKCEPHMALDGGADGLDFYRAICAHWTCLLKPDGIIAFESGYDICDGVEAVMAANGIDKIRRFKDIGGIDRCIIGTVGCKFEDNTCIIRKNDI
ncbi:MAG: peptide chain release factor N(5)-glutamine methyltransferase [Acutalibacteraceae bacterium]